MLIVCQLIIAVVMTLQIIAMGMTLGHCHGDDNLGSLLWGWPLVWGVIGLYSSTAAIVHRKCTLNMQHYERCNSDRGCRFKANILCFSECDCLLWRARLLQIWTQIFVCFYYGHIVFRGKGNTFQPIMILKNKSTEVNFLLFSYVLCHFVWTQLDIRSPPMKIKVIIDLWP